jgi:hypothetical protein
MANKLEKEMELALSSRHDYLSPAEMDLCMRRARHARSEAFAETGRWLITKIRAAFDALFHSHHATPHGPAAA